jgi:alpha-L-rhamnosidase
MAVLSDAATLKQQQAIWSKVLSHVVSSSDPNTTITPYYGYYVLSAMARLDHRPEALAWMRQYWGGMLAEGATSFWEAYDPRWPKQDFHAYLEADGKRGYYASLAHGWASGPTAWLMQQVLGIEPTAAGFKQVTIRPDLAGLAWARGAEPTPRGLIRVDVKPGVVRVVLPKDTVATLILPFPAVQGTLLQNGTPVSVVGTEDGTRSTLVLRSAGDYTFAMQGGSE